MNRTRTIKSSCFMPSGWNEFTKERFFKDSPLHAAVRIARRKLNRFDIIADDVAGIVFEAFATGKVDFETTNPGRSIRYVAEIISYAIRECEGLTSLRQEWPLDDKGNEIEFPSPAAEPLERWRTANLLAELERQVDFMGEVDTAEMSVKMGISRRRAQQIIAEQVKRAGKNGDLFEGGVI